MSLIATTIEGGKYAVVFDDETGELYAKRYGERWRELCGDKFVLCLAQEIERLRAVIPGLLEVIEDRNSQGGGLRLNAEGQARVDAARAVLPPCAPWRDTRPM